MSWGLCGSLRKASDIVQAGSEFVSVLKLLLIYPMVSWAERVLHGSRNREMEMGSGTIYPRRGASFRAITLGIRTFTPEEVPAFLECNADYRKS